MANTVKIENIVATLLEYTNKQGETKKNYLTIGKLFTKDDGKQWIKITNVPIGWDGMAGVYEINEKEERTPLSQQHNVDDDLPF